MSVTVVVATRNRRDQVLVTLPKHQAPVILVDNASTDGTPEAVAEKLPHVRVVRLAVNAGAAARNVGARLAGTPFVAFADDDSYWLDDALGAASRILTSHPTTGLVTARVLVGPQAQLDPISAHMARAPLGAPRALPGPAVLGFLACAAVVRRDAFLAVGGFQPRLHVYGEEALLAMDLAAAGWGLAYVPSLTVRHLPAPDGRDPGGRRRMEARNALLTTWLRRPVGHAMRAASHALSTRDGRAGLRAALADLPWALRHRRPVPPTVEAALRVLETTAQ